MIHLEKMVQLSGWQLQDDVETETTWGPQRVNSKSGNQEMCVSQLYKQCWYRNFQKTINWKCCPLVTLEGRELIITELVAPLEMPHLCIHSCELAFSFFFFFKCSTSPISHQSLIIWRISVRWDSWLKAISCKAEYFSLKSEWDALHSTLEIGTGCRWIWTGLRKSW